MFGGGGGIIRFWNEDVFFLFNIVISFDLNIIREYVCGNYYRNRYGYGLKVIICV